MSRLKNISGSAISIQMFKNVSPKVNNVLQKTTLHLIPLEDVDESLWLVSSIIDQSYNKDIIDNYITDGILTRLP